MPRYDYNCDNCGEMEIEQKMSEEPLVKCPHCGKIGIRKMVNKGTGVIFKGSGWYETDYREKKGDKD